METTLTIVYYSRTFYFICFMHGCYFTHSPQCTSCPALPLLPRHLHYVPSCLQATIVNSERGRRQCYKTEFALLSPFSNDHCDLPLSMTSGFLAHLWVLPLGRAILYLQMWSTTRCSNQFVLRMHHLKLSCGCLCVNLWQPIHCVH